MYLTIVIYAPRFICLYRSFVVHAIAITIANYDRKTFTAQGAYTQYIIFFVTLELAQQVRLFATGNPFQLSVMDQSSLLVWGRIHNTSLSS